MKFEIKGRNSGYGKDYSFFLFTYNYIFFCEKRRNLKKIDQHVKQSLFLAICEWRGFLPPFLLPLIRKMRKYTCSNLVPDAKSFLKEKKHTTNKGKLERENVARGERYTQTDQTDDNCVGKDYKIIWMGITFCHMLILSSHKHHQTSL